MQTLLIDNYDSFTYNLFQLLAEVNGAEPIVVRNDEAGWEELEPLGFDNVVISPGPGRPDAVHDFGVCAEVIRRCEAPLLGVCLGHQGIGWVEGGRVERVAEPRHGRASLVEHDGSPLFAGIPSPFSAVRYHSLGLARPLPPSLREIAWSEGVPMAIEHRTLPRWGVQFHPESIATEHGRRLIESFRDLTAGGRVELLSEGERSSTRQGGFVSPGGTIPPRSVGTTLRVSHLDVLPDAEAAFVSLYGESESAFWLDSSRVGARGRFSFMGDASGPLAETVTYDVEAGELTVRSLGREAVRRESVLDYLQRRAEELRPASPPTLPFELDCGFVGYLGYELKAECGHSRAHASDHPDAAFVLADRLVAFDHDQDRAYLLALHEQGEEAEAEEWLSSTAERLATLAQEPPAGDGATEPLEGAGGGFGGPSPLLSAEPSPGAPRNGSHRSFDHSSPDSPPREPHLQLARSPERYRSDVETCIDRLLEGDSYELCLTNQLSAELDVDPLALYRRLRRANPAPFAAYLRFGDLAVLSSSPERFLRVGADREVEARPIKGTGRRGGTPAEDARLAAELAGCEKNRAENLMIVDLLRNDLGAVCEVGSVEVPAMMEVETYETVHQLVSQVRGRLRPGASTLDCVRSCFPPGSMTGAPKRRATEILDALEGAARGVYSGAIGWLGLSGAADLSVAIRTIVLDDGCAWIGAGGAVVLQSDPAEEHGEMLLKAAAPLRAIDPGADPASISLAVEGAAAATPP